MYAFILFNTRNLLLMAFIDLLKLNSKNVLPKVIFPFKKKLLH